MRRAVLRTDRDDNWPGREPGTVGTVAPDTMNASNSTDSPAPAEAGEQDTEPVLAVAVRESHARRWAARLGVVDIALVLLAAVVIGVDLFVGLGGLRIAGNGTSGVAVASGTATHHTTPTATLAPQVTSTPPAIPAGVIKFGGGGDTTATQQCNGTQPLDNLTYSLSNTQSTVAVDWWVDVQGTTPDGKSPWASANRPYGTLPAGQLDSFTLTPNPVLCTQLAGQPPAVYKAVVSYGGVGAFNITDTITSGPGAGPTPTATGSPTGP